MTDPDLDKKRREKLLDRMARVALAIQASGRTEVHQDFIEILKLLPIELRRCPECDTSPGEEHCTGCTRTLSQEEIDAFYR
jgi:hypothetical protein